MVGPIFQVESRSDDRAPAVVHVVEGGEGDLAFGVAAACPGGVALHAPGGVPQAFVPEAPLARVLVGEDVAVGVPLPAVAEGIVQQQSFVIDGRLVQQFPVADDIRLQMLGEINCLVAGDRDRRPDRRRVAPGRARDLEDELDALAGRQVERLLGRLGSEPLGQIGEADLAAAGSGGLGQVHQEVLALPDAQRDLRRRVEVHVEGQGRRRAQQTDSGSNAPPDAHAGTSLSHRLLL